MTKFEENMSDNCPKCGGTTKEVNQIIDQTAFSTIRQIGRECNVCGYFVDRPDEDRDI